MRWLYFCLAIVLVIGCLLSCSETKTTPVDQTITLTWTAVGNEGSIGQAALYDLRWSLDSLKLKDTAQWSSCQQIAGLPAPKPSGMAESFTFHQMCESNTPYFYSIRVRSFPWKSCDTCTSTYVLWSRPSNIAKRFFPTSTPPSPILDLQ